MVKGSAVSSKKGVILLIIVIALVAAFVLSYPYIFVDKISEVKDESNIGKSIMVRGEVKSVIKIGELSGYILEDESGTIAVSSEKLPTEGETITVRGTLIKDILLGYYVKV